MTKGGSESTRTRHQPQITAKLCRAEMMVGLCGCGGVQTCKSESGGKQLLRQVGP